MNPLGRNRWAIAEGYIPSTSHGPAPQMTSHETVCILNVTNLDATVLITIFIRIANPVARTASLSRQDELGMYD